MGLKKNRICLALAFMAAASSRGGENDPPGDPEGT